MNLFKNIEVSCFANYKTSKNPKSVNLWTWLNSDKYKRDVERIRAATDKRIKDHLKAKLPAITPSGTFWKRGNDALLCHSGFICIDIDYKGNEHIGNFAELKKELSNIQEVAYCGLSVSGNGYFVLIPLVYPKQHLGQFKALEKDFLSIGISIDAACKDVSRLRGYSYDNEAYFNHDAIPYENIYTPEQKKYQGKYSANTNIVTSNDWTKQNVETLIQEIEVRRTDVTEGYNTWFAIAVGFASVFGESGRDYFHRVSQFHTDYEQAATDRKFSDALRSKYNGTLGAFFNACANQNIRYKELSSRRVAAIP